MKTLLPAIDLRGGQVVRLLQGDYDRQTTYEADPVDQAKAFEQAGAGWVHVVDLDGAKAGAPVNLSILESIRAATDLKIDFGGGVRDTESVRRLVDLGIDRIVVGTAALKNWCWFEDLVHRPAFAHRVVLGLDAKAGKPAVSGWLDVVDCTALAVAEKTRGWPLAAINFTDIATDGTLAGPNLELTEVMCHATDVPIVASGGVGSLSDLLALRGLPISGAIVGKALYDGALSIQAALGAFERGEV